MLAHVTIYRSHLIGGEQVIGCTARKLCVLLELLPELPDMVVARQRQLADKLARNRGALVRAHPLIQLAHLRPALEPLRGIACRGDRYASVRRTVIVLRILHLNGPPDLSGTSSVATDRDRILAYSLAYPQACTPEWLASGHQE
jgi:hypothetical protein